jgi:hypothetical protein
MEDKYTPYKKCEKCVGIRSPSDFAKLSPEERVRIFRRLEEDEVKIRREQQNIRNNCEHPKLTTHHWHYDMWAQEWIDDNFIKKVGGGEESRVWCEICGKDFGWQCDKNPKGYCEYPSDLKEEEEFGVSILYCAYCKMPKDRWNHLSEARLGFPPPPTYEPSKEELKELTERHLAEKVALQDESIR